MINKFKGKNCETIGKTVSKLGSNAILKYLCILKIMSSVIVEVKKITNKIK